MRKLGLGLKGLRLLCKGYKTTAKDSRKQGVCWHESMLVPEADKKTTGFHYVLPRSRKPSGPGCGHEKSNPSPNLARVSQTMGYVLVHVHRYDR